MEHRSEMEHHNIEARLCEIQKQLCEMRQQLCELHCFVKDLFLRGIEMSQQFDDLMAETKKNRSVTGSLIVILAGYQERAAAAVKAQADGDDAKAAEILAELKANNQVAADAVLANTPAEPA